MRKKHNIKRIVAIGLVVLVGVPMLFFGMLAGQNIFAREEDQIPRDVAVTAISKSSATIKWVTDQKIQGVIEYGISPNVLNFYAPEPATTKDHAVELTLLTPSTPYYFIIRVGDKIHDNAGMPWTFTTKSITGEDVSDQVRGITTRISDAEKKQKSINTKSAVCTAKTCAEIQLQLGKGCAMTDYIKLKCMGTSVQSTTSPSTSTTFTAPYISPTPTASVLGTSTTTITITPQPTSVLIRSYSCNLDYLQADMNSTNKCSRWTWDSLNTKTEICRKAFGRYILECKDRSFESSSGSETPSPS